MLRKNCFGLATGLMALIQWIRATVSRVFRIVKSGHRHHYGQAGMAEPSVVMTDLCLIIRTSGYIFYADGRLPMIPRACRRGVLCAISVDARKERCWLDGQDLTPTQVALGWASLVGRCFGQLSVPTELQRYKVTAVVRQGIRRSKSPKSMDNGLQLLFCRGSRVVVRPVLARCLGEGDALRMQARPIAVLPGSNWRELTRSLTACSTTPAECVPICTVGPCAAVCIHVSRRPHLQTFGKPITFRASRRPGGQSSECISSDETVKAIETATVGGRGLSRV
ncbi:hypothetical protein V8F06_009502 [Rhypophila decipiens]